MRIDSTSARVTLTAAVLAVTFWTAKAVAIGAAGGLDRSPLESPFFFAGMFSFLVAVIGLGVTVTRGRPVWQRVLGGLFAVVVGVGVNLAIDAVVVAVRPADPSWMWSELQLWLLAPLALAAALVVTRRSRVRVVG